ncbi:hypothetical protein ACLI4Q_16150 [Natrialbaceae archaeon A-CW1-1]
MPDRKQVTVWVSDSQLNDWDTYANELGYQSRGSMIRRAVESFYHRETAEMEQEMGVEDELMDLQDQIQSLRLDVQDVRREQMSKNDMDTLVRDIDSVVELRNLLTYEDMMTAERRQEALDEYFGTEKGQELIDKMHLDDPSGDD